ncbi:MAG: DUF4446 family protein [Lachnospiraceae bacterium]|nr:DUF4446 family protein [Lachnospiraceae bacterium]
MNSRVLESMGIADWDMGLVMIIIAAVIFILAVTCVVLSIELSKFRKRYDRFCGGRDAGSLEHEIGEVFRENKAIKEQTEKNRKDIRILYRNFESAFSKVGLVKYDAFPQMGGKLSFSLALLDEKNNGFIINSVHGRDGCYTYTKEIKGGLCDLTLGGEEEKALNAAMKIQA